MTNKSVHLLRIYTDASARRDGRPYWQALMDRARGMDLDSASALQVLDRFGEASTVHQARATDLTSGERVIVEIAGTEPSLRKFRDTLEVTDDAGLVTLESVTVVGYGGHRHPTQA